jgi:HlyD family secretion protein/adhesin transport system membrane fusion protein
MNLGLWVRNGKKAQVPEHLTLPLELEDGQPARFHASMLRALMLGVVVLGLWASLTPIRELVIANGQILPEGDVRAIQHLEGGIVASIAARPGMSVRKGDMLLALADDQAARDLGQLSVRARALSLQKQQIGALLTSSGLELRSIIDTDAELVNAQQNVFAARRKARIDEAFTLAIRIEQRRAEIASVKNEIEGYKRLVDIQEERVNLRDDMLKKGLGTRRDFLADKASHEQAKSQQLAAEGRLTLLEQQLGEALSQASKAEAEARRNWTEELARIESELGEVQESIAKLTDRVERLAIRSPADGIVHFILPRSRGEVVKPGDVVARVVPVDVPLLAEVEVKIDDIGHVKVGDAVDVRVSTFDPSVYGKLHGRVTAISAATFQRQNGEYFFKGTVALDQTQLNGNAPVLVGMGVSAEIITGAKSFSRYLLKSVFRNFDQAFTEK